MTYALFRRYINDYNLDSNNAKTQGMVTLVKKINAANPGLIQGCGTQGHLSVIILLPLFRLQKLIRIMHRLEVPVVYRLL